LHRDAALPNIVAMKIGIALPQRGNFVDPQAIKTFAQTAEAHDFDCLWVHERLFAPFYENRIGGASNDLSPWELMTFAAACTDRIRIGSSVIIIGYYQPLMLAKKAATLDVLSNGRLNLGLGLGLSKEEYLQSKVDFHTRGRRSAEFIHALRACWKDDPISFEGEFFSIPEASTSPKPIQRDADGNPCIPIIGGFSSEPGKKRTAELCDTWQSAGKDMETALAAHKANNDYAAAEFGKPPLKLIWRCWVIPPGSNRKPPEQTGDRVVPFWHGSMAELVDKVHQAKEGGVDELIIDTNWFGGDGSEDRWEEQPELLSPMVEAAHS
jgi:probable F420-dependent oxidoreductase